MKIKLNLRLRIKLNLRLRIRVNDWNSHSQWILIKLNKLPATSCNIQNGLWVRRDKNKRNNERVTKMGHILRYK